METTVLKAKNNLSALLRAVENGEDVIIRRGRSGAAFRIVTAHDTVGRTLEPDPRWQGQITYQDDDIWASEWTAEK